MVDEADGIKLVRQESIQELALPAGGLKNHWGTKPHSIRKKGWHRAHRRGSLYIILPYHEIGSKEDWKKKYARVFFDRNCPNATGYIMWPFETGDTPE